MCPDNQLISAFIDGELDSRWADVVDAHLVECSRCRELAAGYRNLRTVLQKSEYVPADEVKRRMYDELKRRQAVVVDDGFWHRDLRISVPVLMAAAAMVVVFFTGMLLGIIPIGQSSPQYAEAVESEIPDVSVQVLSLEDAAAYLLSDDSGFDLLITIPSSEPLSVAGKPRLIREAEYRRGQ